MFNKSCGLFLLLIALSGIGSLQAISPLQKSPKDTIIIQSSPKTYIPFTFFQKPVLQVINDKLNIAVTDRTGDMIQVNGIDITTLQKGLLPKSAYRVVYISQKRGTASDDADANSMSMLEFTQCTGNKTGSAITLGLKATVTTKGKSYRIYATLSGIIPSYSYHTTN
ncbi:MAG: hypothetical protein V4590_11040 [Bacteroidota bacterium]